eukprot:COSAG06_NODE_1742_length_8503_cov_6.223703_9_plen_32_part_00
MAFPQASALAVSRWEQTVTFIGVVSLEEADA